WMPLPRAALYAQGEDVHVAVWPGSQRNTQDITRFIAQEARSYVVSVSCLMRKSDIPDDVPQADRIRENSEAFLTDGGSCVASPNGTWLLEPQVGEEGLYTATLDHQKIREERQNFDPSGHYSRPDVTQLVVNRERQSVVKFSEGE
ncbi:MAG: nitrilase-related carbon-nitrogen hydrolase, partial [Tunicatimonas sp.]|uniref:nitrilase-related carbon-nitrogen hydrolase n=1 Tax=Tunicatimonas sp. TaxID=1940096 RepID=UPI003C7884B4